jgi:hypothetical protein
MMHYVLTEANALCERKSQDYNNADSSNSVDPARNDYFPYGHQSYLHMLWTKFKRIETVVLSGKESANFESARDSLLDLINYASFYAAYLDQIKNPQLTEDEQYVS